MASQIIANLIPLGVLGFLVALIVLSLPYRRPRQFTVATHIAAAPKTVWDIHQFDPDDPRSAAAHPNTVAQKVIQDTPMIVEETFDRSGGHRTAFATVRVEIIDEREPERTESRVLEVDGRPWPLGEDNWSIAEFREVPGGTELSYSWGGETATLWQYLAIRRAVGRYIRDLKRVSETDSVAPVVPPRAFTWKTLALSIAALGSFALWLGWVAALALAAILIVHEFGHWLAFRMSGHPAPRIMLLPFLGGVAVGNHPHRTRFDEAFCALMGPAISIVPCAVLLAATVALAPPHLTAVPGWFTVAQYLDPPQSYAMVTAALTLGVGALNLLQLVPLLPLDGGQVLRAVLHSFGAVWARRTLLAVAAAGVAGFVWLDDYIIAAVAALGGVGAWHMDTRPSDVRPMGVLAVSVIGVGYAVTLAVHAGATIFGLWALDILLELI